MGPPKIAVIGAGENLFAGQAEKKFSRGIQQLYTIQCLHQLNDTQLDNAKVLAVVMLMYNLMEYKNNYANSLPCLWQCHKDGLNDNS